MMAALPAGQVAQTPVTATPSATGGSRGMIDTTATPATTSAAAIRFPGLQQHGTAVMDALRRGDMNAYNQNVDTLLRSHLLRFGGDKIANALQTSAPSRAAQSILMGR